MHGGIREGSLEEMETELYIGRALRGMGHVARVSVRELEVERAGEVNLWPIYQHGVRIGAKN